jgi:hypothetical protein
VDLFVEIFSFMCGTNESRELGRDLPTGGIRRLGDRGTFPHHVEPSFQLPLVPVCFRTAPIGRGT